MPFQGSDCQFPGGLMSEAEIARRPFSNDQLARLHKMTQQIEKVCRAQLRGYLDALAPLFRPRRLLGDHMEGSGREHVSNADSHLNEFREIYFKACARPFDLRKEMPLPLESVSTQLQLHEWEYKHEIQTGRERKSVTITSPLTWVLSYPATYSYGMARQVVAGNQEQDVPSLRSFLLRSCLMRLMFSQLPELAGLFEGLRYRIEIRKCRELGDLPLVTISAPIATVLPPDDVLALASAVAGRPGFVEVIDTKQAAIIPDPLRDQVTQIIAADHEDSILN